MSEYLPKFDSGLAVTRRASADITGGQVVVVTGDGTVGPSAGASAAWYGVAGFDVKNGEDVTVYKAGVQRPIASGAIAAGDIVVTAANGRVATNAAPGAGQQVGVAQSTAADGESVDVDFIR
jgi:hypothetical protein